MAVVPTNPPTCSQRLVVDLLGPPAVTWDGQPYEISRRQPRGLLYYLAIHLHPVSRAQLCHLLWPDKGEAQARRNVSRLLNNLRRALPAPDLLLVDDEQIQLDAPLLQPDTVQFMRLHGENPDQASPEALQAAVQLYRGEFLDGFALPNHPEYEFWMAQERRVWERRYLGALRRLVERHSAEQRYGAAINYLHSYLQADPLAEQMHARLITLYTLTGQRSEALRQYERCLVILERELGVDPAPATRAAYEDALAGNPSPPPAAVLAPRQSTQIRHAIPLVDRSHILSELQRGYGQAQRGNGRLILLAGEPGTGKSRLLREFVARLPSDTPIIQARGGAGLQQTPYGLLVQALRCGMTRYGLPPLDAGWLTVLGQILPELDEVETAALPQRFDPETSQTRLLEALNQLLFAWGGPHRPVVLCLDDLHWADGATYTWLAYLAHSLADAGGLVVGAYRTGVEPVAYDRQETAPAQDLVRLRHALARCHVLTELELEGLDRASARQLIASLLLDEADDALSKQADQYEPLMARLHRWTGGNPFLLITLLRDLRSRGWRPGVGLALEQIALPSALLASVRERLHDLDGLARQVLDAAAVLGETFTFEQVQQVCGRSELEAIDALDKLEAQRLLDEEPERYRFRHALVQVAIYRELSHHRRRLLEARKG